VSHRVGQAMCYWIMPISGVPISRSTVQAINDQEIKQDDVQKQVQNFNTVMREKIGTILNQTQAANSASTSPDRYIDEDDVTEDMEQVEQEGDMPENDDFDAETYDQYISANVLLPKGDGMLSGTVVGRKRDTNGNPIGNYSNNPILDSRVYEVEFPDGHVEEYSANTIAESLYAQVDDEGNQYLILKEIIDYNKDHSAISKDDMYTYSSNGNQIKRRTTKGWKLCILWKDGSTTWEPLRNLKESNPVEVAEFAVANKLASEPAFAWWISDVLRRRDRIISKVRSRYWKRTHKFGIRIPKTVAEALQFDDESGTDLWYKAIQKEMKNVMPAFQFLDADQRVPIGYKWIPCHIIFDIKMDFTRKARLVAGGHVTDPPTTHTYSSVVSRDSVRIALLIAALNDLDVLAADIGNAYLNAKTREKVYTTAGKEFGSKQGQPVLIVRALYGLKTSGAEHGVHI
ncbi:MAG: reverse transcriptase domain-containing protein, partial [Gaiellaceae bacterium]